MRYYVRLTNHAADEYIDARVVASSEEEAERKLLSIPEAQRVIERWGECEIEATTYQIADVAEPADGRFVLQPSEEQGWWVVTDAETLLCLRFKEGEYNTSQKVTPINEHPANPLDGATSMRLMADWMRTNHPELL